MGRDRLEELRQRVQDVGEEETEETVVDGLVEHEVPEELAAVLEEAERLHGYVDEINANTKEARWLRADAAFSQSQELQRRLEVLLSRATSTGAPLCAALQRLAGLGTSPTVAGRVARLHWAGARSRANEALHEHHTLLVELQDRRRRLLVHQLRLLEVPLTADECERLLEEEEGGGGGKGQVMLFVGDVSAQTEAALSALRAAEERHEDLLQVEKKLREVNELFVQLALLVAAQQESIDTVEQAAAVASQRVVEGHRELLQGHVRKRKARRKKLWLWLCLSSGAMVVLLVLVFT